MLVFKEAEISTLFKKKQVNDLTIDLGYHIFKRKDKLIFDFLTLKSGGLSKGSLLVNGVDTANNNNESSLISLKVSSKVVNLYVTFAILREEKSKFMSAILEELTGLRDMPLEDEEQQKNKIESILKVINKDENAYVLADFNDKTNGSYQKLITDIFESYKDKMCIISLENFSSLKENNLALKENKDKQETEGDFSLKEIVSESNYVFSSSSNQEELTNIKKRQSFIKEMKNDFVSFMKDNWLHFVFVFLFSALAIFGISLAPTLFGIPEKIAVSTVLLIIGIMFYGTLFYICASAFPSFFIYKKTTTFLFLISMSFLFLSELLGFLSGIGFIFLLTSNDFFVSKDILTFSSFIPAIIVSSVSLILPFFGKPLGKVYVVVVNLLKKILRR